MKKEDYSGIDLIDEKVCSKSDYKSSMIKISKNTHEKASGIFKSLSEYPIRSKAIQAKCIDCMGYENHANRIRACSTTSCPLWIFRPYQRIKV